MIQKIALILILLLAFQPTKAQDSSFKIEKNTVIVDENGKKISVNDFVKRVNNESIQLDIEKDENGKTKLIRIKKANPKSNNIKSKEGQKAPDFALTDMQGNTIDSKKLKGKIIVLNFWFTSCMPCIAEIPKLNAVYKKYKDNPDVVFIAITFNRKEKVEKFLQHHPMQYTVIPFDNPTCTKFGVSGFPTNIVIDKTGKYQWISLGGHSGIDKEIIKQIEKALK
jgi:peroxiredoxin